MKKNKWITLITIILAISLVTVIASPTLPRNIWYDLNKMTVRCVDAPDYKNCVCGEEFDKTLVDGEYICIPHSPTTSLDCEWCNKECVEWKKLPPPGLNGCDRTPLIGKVCLVDIVEGHKLCAPKVPVPQGNLITFCTKEELSKMIDYFEGSFENIDGYLKEHCDGLIFPLDNCQTSYDSFEFTYEQGTKSGNWMECRSECIDDFGNIVGGHIVWNLKYDFNLNQLVGVKPVSVNPYPTDACGT